MAPARAPAMPSVIRRPWMDYSCYARIENRSDRPLRLVRREQGRRLLLGRPAAGGDPAALARRHLGPGLDRAAAAPAAASRTPTGRATLEFVLACPTGVVAQRRPLAGPELPDEDRQLRPGAAAESTGSGTRCRRASSSRRCARPPSCRPRATGRRRRRPASSSCLGEAGGRVAARILWPALGFPAVIAPRSAPQGPPARSTRSACCSSATARRSPPRTPHATCGSSRGSERTRRQVRADLRRERAHVRSGAALERPQKDKHGDAVVFGGDRYERLHRREPVAGGPRVLRQSRACAICTRSACRSSASGRLPDGQYHLLWNGSAPSGPSDEMRLLVDRFAVPRRRRIAANTEAERFWLRQQPRLPVDEYRFEYGALHPPYQAAPQRRFTEVLHPGVRPPPDRQPQDRPPHRHARRRPQRRLRGEPPPGADRRDVDRRRSALLPGRPRPVQQLEPRLRRPLRGREARRQGDPHHRRPDRLRPRAHRARRRRAPPPRARPSTTATTRDRNWFLFYYLLAAGDRYTQPVYTSLGNHDWRLNPYPPFAPETPEPDVVRPQLPSGSTTPCARGRSRRSCEIAHGPGHDKAFAYADLDLRRIATASALRAGYLAAEPRLPRLSGAHHRRLGDLVPAPHQPVPGLRVPAPGRTAGADARLGGARGALQHAR